MCINVPEGFGKPLSGPIGVPASKEDIVKLVKGWEEDLQTVTEVSGLALRISFDDAV